MNEQKTEAIQEYVSTRSPRSKIDRDAGIIHDVKILGLESRNHRIYPVETLRRAIPLYENARVNLNHPDGNPAESRKYQDRFGLIKNVRLTPEEGLFGDFHFNPKHVIAEQLLWDAENSPENVGFSHNVQAVLSERDGQQVVEEIHLVRSVDLVADPATTAGLFEEIQSGVVTSDLGENREESETTETDPNAWPKESEPIDGKKSFTETTSSDEDEKIVSVPSKLSQNTAGRFELMEHLLTTILSDSGKTLSNQSSFWSRGFIKMILEIPNFDLAKRFVTERLDLIRRFGENIRENCGDEPIQAAAGITESRREPFDSTEEFVKQIKNR